MNQTVNSTTDAPARKSSDAGWVALLLVTAGVLVLAGRVWPLAGDALALVLGVELLIWARAARQDGPLIAGGIVTGVGAGIVFAAGPLEGAAANVIGGTFLLCIAAGFALVGLLSQLWLHDSQLWAWITAVAVGLVGGGVFAGADTMSQVITWGLPVVQLAVGVAIGAYWMRARRR
jgi:hypothetical protein